MKKLLVPIDGSANSNRAVRYAMELAAATGGMRIVLLNVQEELERWYKHGLNSEAARQHLRQLGEAAAAESRSLLNRAGVLFDFMIVFGEAAEVIARVAKEEGCFAIVIGTRGMGEVESAFLGSTSYKVLHLAEVPVILVK